MMIIKLNWSKNEDTKGMTQSTMTTQLAWLSNIY